MPLNKVTGSPRQVHRPDPPRQRTKHMHNMIEEIEEEDIIMTTTDVSTLIPEGTRGIVHQVYITHPRAYLIEFIDEEDTPIDTIEIPAAYIELATKAGSAALRIGRRA